MPTDLTGTPTPNVGIGTYNVDADAPSGLGFNAAMGQIDTIFTGYPKTPAGIVAGEAMIWNGTTFVRSSNTGLSPSGIAGYPSDGTKALFGDGSWKTTSSAGKELDYAAITSPNAAVTATTEATAVAQITGNSVTYDGSAVYVEFFIPELIASVQNTVATFVLLRDTTVIGQIKYESMNSGTNALPGIFGKTKDTPSAAAHTYKLAMFVSSGNYTVEAGNGTSGNLVPAFLRVTKA